MLRIYNLALIWGLFVQWIVKNGGTEKDSRTIRIYLDINGKGLYYLNQSRLYFLSDDHPNSTKLNNNDFVKVYEKIVSVYIKNYPINGVNKTWTSVGNFMNDIGVTLPDTKGNNYVLEKEQ